MKKMHKVVAIFCILATSIMFNQTVFAADNNSDYPVAPIMTYIVDYWIGFGITDDTAEVDVDVTGSYIDATRAKVIAELQVKSGDNWIPVAIWTDDQEGYTAGIDETHDVVSGHTYRVKGTFIVWEGDAYETEMSYSDEITA